MQRFALCLLLAWGVESAFLSELVDFLAVGDNNNPLHMFLRVQLEQFYMQENNNNNNNATIVVFRLYTKSQPSVAQVLGPSTVATSAFDARKPTRIMAHGFRSSSDSDTSQRVKDAYLAHQDVNVVLVDWRVPASTPNYVRAARDTPRIGGYLAHLVDALVDAGASAEDIHLVGHSLGAHIVGFAGKLAKQRVGRITGLDPAGPLFETPELMVDHLSADKADFVDVIHTSAGALGYSAPIGHVDFYPNGGGAPQPGCGAGPVEQMLGTLAAMFDGCSHGRSWVYFADSIDPHQVYLAQVESQGAPVVMGEYARKDYHGVYYLNTNSQPPYPLN